MFFTKQYRPASLLAIFNKVFERFLTLFNTFMQNKLFTHCEAGFIPCDL